MYDLVVHVLSAAYNLNVPFINVAFGRICIMIWTIPMLVRFIKSIF